MVPTKPPTTTGLTEPSLPQVPQAFSQGMKLMKHEADCLPLSHAEIRTVWSYTSTTPHASWHRLQRDIFTFILLCRLEIVDITTFTPTIYTVKL
jgi:hypothetical protein